MKTAKFTRFYDSEEGLRMEKKKAGYYTSI